MKTKSGLTESAIRKHLLKAQRQWAEVQANPEAAREAIETIKFWEQELATVQK